MQPPAHITPILDDIAKLSGRGLTRRDDLGFLLEESDRTQREQTLQDLSFQATFLARTYRIMQRIGPDGKGYDTLSREFATALGRVRALLLDLLIAAPPDVRARFDQEYVSMTPGSLASLLELCSDLSLYQARLVDMKSQRLTAGTQPTRGVLWRSALLLTAVCATLWLGAALMRGVIGYQLLQTDELALRGGIAPDAERMLYHLLTVAGLISAVCYLGTLLGAGIFLSRSPFPLQEHGWLLISAILLFLFVPVEAYTMLLDYRLMGLVWQSPPAPLDAVREVFLARAGALRGAPFVAMLGYFTIFALAIFQPLRRRDTSS